MSAASTSTAEIKAVAHRLMDEVWSKGNLSAVDQIAATTFVNHDPSTPGSGSGPQGYKEIVTLYRNAFPDAQFTIDDIVAEEDKVAVRYTCRGTHKGPLRDIPPSGRRVTVTGMLIFRMASAKIEEVWVNWDTLGLLQQVGVLPS